MINKKTFKRNGFGKIKRNGFGKIKRNGFGKIKNVQFLKIREEGHSFSFFYIIYLKALLILSGKSCALVL